MGGVAGNIKTANLACYSAPIAQYIAWVVGMIGFLLASTNLYLAIRGKVPSQIIIAALFMVICLATLAAAWFLSEFCFTF